MSISYDSVLLPNIPLLFCPQHPSFQLNLVCRLETCNNRGPICCRCLVKQHYANGHSVDSIVPLDDLIMIMQQTVNSNRINDIHCFPQRKIPRLFEIIDEQQKKNQKLHNEINSNLNIINEKLNFIRQEQINNSQNELRQEYRCLQLINELNCLTHEQENDYETPTDTGNSILLEKNKKKELIQLLCEVSTKIQIVDGQFNLEIKNDSGRMEQNLDNTSKYTQKILDNALFDYRFCVEVQKIQLGISKNIQTQIMQNWEMIYDRPYSHKCNTKELLNLKNEFHITDEDLICISAVENEQIILCGTDEYNKIFIQSNDTKKAQKSDKAEIFWYFVAKRSFGFSPVEEVNLDDGDCGTEGDRISWNLNGDGGYRVGALTELYKNQNIRKRIYLLRRRNTNN